MWSLASSGQTSDRITLKAGIGIDNIKLLKTSPSVVKKYKNLTYKIRNGGGIACAINETFHWRRKQVSNASYGIKFAFSSKRFKYPFYRFKKKLTSITLTSNSYASFENGITILKSTKKQVIDEFGQLPEGSENDIYIRYEDQGVAFKFNDDMVLIQVEIFKKIKHERTTKGIKT